MRSLACCSILLLGLCLLAGPASGKTWVVAQDGSGDFTHIQEAVLSAYDGDEILVHPGIYTERLSIVAKALQIRSTGGALHTTIDAESTGSAVTFYYAPSADGLLEGFTIVGGTGTVLRAGLRPSPSAGGGAGEASARAGATGPAVGKTGMSGGETPDVETPDAAAELVRRRAGDGETRQERFGGGILLYASNPTLRHLVLQGDGADVGGGLFGLFSSSHISDCRFTGNLAGRGSGAALEFCDEAMLERCLFESNLAAVGGGLSLYQSSPLLTDCTLSGNQAGEGGGLYVLGPMDSPAVVQRTLFRGNFAQDGSAACVTEGALDLISCTVARNGLAGYGRASLLYRQQSVGSLQRTIVAFNDTAVPLEVEASAVSTACCDFYDPMAPAPPPPLGPTDFALDPLFCGPGDYHLRSRSPCRAPVSPHGCGLVGAFGEGCPGAGRGAYDR